MKLVVKEKGYYIYKINSTYYRLAKRFDLSGVSWDLDEVNRKDFTENGVQYTNYELESNIDFSTRKKDLLEILKNIIK